METSVESTKIIYYMPSQFEHIKGMTGQKGKAPEPTFVFEVMYHQETDMKFESLKNGRKSLYAYHGSRFDNFFSILHNGLNTHLNKVLQFVQKVSFM